MKLAKRIRQRLVRGLRRSSLARRTVERFFQDWYQLPVPPTHFYSPLPDVAETVGNQARWYREGDFSRVPMDVEGQLALLTALEKFTPELADLPSFNQLYREGYGPGYGEIEAQLLHCMIRHFQPRRMIEVGSGVSTFFSHYAMRANRERDGIPFQIECVEPYPSDKLRELAGSGSIGLHVKQVQDVPAEFFQSLGDGDLLFIDSTHAGKIDSDVFHLYLEVVPKLNPGVLVHIHDIPFPYLTVAPSHWLFRQTILWNEAAIVKALLTDSSTLRVLMCQSLLHYQHSAALRRLVPAYDPARHFPDALWLRKAARE